MSLTAGGFDRLVRFDSDSSTVSQFTSPDCLINRDDKVFISQWRDVMGKLCHLAAAEASVTGMGEGVGGDR